MRKGSLKLRLLGAGIASILLALAIAGVGLLLLFERHVERRMTAELDLHLRQLLGHLGRGPDGALELVRPLGDPRFDEPLSGLYWQISHEPGGGPPILRSRSLWDAALTLPTDPLTDGGAHQHTIPGPARSSLLAIERAVALPATLGEGQIRAVVAVDRAEVHAAGRAFASDLFPSIAVLAAFLVAAAWVQVTVGLQPLDAVRRKLSEVRAGRAARLGEAFPDEVRPLAAEVDHLLDAQERAIERARARAADLAHGLKTPLTVLSADAAELRSRGETRLAEEIATVTDGMRRHVERELARARAGARTHPGAPQPVRPVAERITAVLRRTPRGQELAWELDIPADVTADIDAQDLSEVLGNLAENAVKWAAHVIRVIASRPSGTFTLIVEDDGPGVADEVIGVALARGGRLDETQPGSGLGLAIVGDLVENYGGELSLRRSPLGGLAAEVRIPCREISGGKAGLRRPASVP